MIHYGDITKISGYDVPLVDIVCGGSPCQDLSIAGKRKGLDGERSGLFMEQIRIVKEMRERDKQDKQRNGADVDLRCLSPRYMVWENVPGALSSNNGRDFQAVLTEIIRICEPNADDVPLYGGGGDERLGLLQEQYSEYPTDALFPSPTEYMMHSFGEYPNEERESHLWQILTVYPHPKYYLSAKACQGILNRSTKRGKKLPKLLEEVLLRQSVSKNEPDVRGGKGILIQNDRTGALSTVNNQYVLSDTVCIEGNGQRPFHKGDGYIESDKMYTLNATEQHGVAYAVDLYNQTIGGGISKTLNSAATDADHVPCVITDCSVNENIITNLQERSDQEHIACAYSQDAYDAYSPSDSSASLKANGGNYGGGSESLIVSRQG